MSNLYKYVWQFGQHSFIVSFEFLPFLFLGRLPSLIGLNLLMDIELLRKTNSTNGTEEKWLGNRNNNNVETFDSVVFSLVLFVLIELAFCALSKIFFLPLFGLSVWYFAVLCIFFHHFVCCFGGLNCVHSYALASVVWKHANSDKLTSHRN